MSIASIGIAAERNGTSEFRTTCIQIIRRQRSPFARAVRT